MGEGGREWGRIEGEREEGVPEGPVEGPGPRRGDLYWSRVRDSTVVGRVRTSGPLSVSVDRFGSRSPPFWGSSVTVHDLLPPGKVDLFSMLFIFIYNE